MPLFNFAWVPEGTPFNPSTMERLDEEIVSFEIKHDEGQIPTLDMILKNPRVGLLAPGRNVWGWLSWRAPANDPNYPGALVPLFFGVLQSVPANLFEEKIAIKLVARSPQYIANKQALAETMKSFPYYDPIWTDAGRRDDPDTILEGWSALWHIDRTTLDITASDVLNGEDGTIIFDEQHAVYKSVSLQLGQPPLNNIRVAATVNWTQRFSGFFTVPTVNISSYTGESLLSDWPKAGAGIGGGYKVESSFVTDTFFVSQTPSTSWQMSWTNSDPNPGQCSNASASTQSSGPALLSPNPLTAVLTNYYRSGVCFPDSDPPQNISMEASTSGIVVPLWNVSMDMSVRYDANRAFSEIITFDMTANTQGVLASPLVEQHTELITISSVDIGEPLVEVDAWTDFASKPVGLAQVIFPNNPTTPGGLSYQICVVSGTAGATEPEFSDIVGFTTNDNSVVWASLGTNPLTNIPRWQPGQYVPLGMIMLMQAQQFNNATGEFELVPGQTSYYLCTGQGQTNQVYDVFQYTPPVGSNVEVTPAIRTISTINPPNFSTTLGAQIQDGSVTWTVLGTAPAMLGIPVGGTADNVTANNFFPTPRGILAFEYLISKARARLRWRARAVDIGWDCFFTDAVAASCRKNATLYDPRFPGGAATGKIKSYTLTFQGGKLRGHIEIGCSVGLGDSIPAITGTPTYVTTGYVAPGYQRYEGQTISHGSGDITYSKPIYVPFDDGLRPPLRWQDISDGGVVSGTLAAQAAAIKASFATAQLLTYLQSWGGSISGGTAPNTTLSGVPPDTAWKLEREELALASQNTPYVMNANPISWSALIKPCAGNGPFGGSYSPFVSPLVLPMGINLEALSSP